MSAVAELRVLVPGDEAFLFDFLSRSLETSLFFFSNIERAGLVDHGQLFQGTYLARIDASGAITAVVGHSWNGNVLLQGDVGLEDAVRRVADFSKRQIRGLIGPWALVCRARRALGLEEVPAVHDGVDLLYTVSLDELQVPALLSRDEVALRVPTPREAREVLPEWRADYHVEILGKSRTPALGEQSRREIENWLASGTLWVLSVGGAPVAMTGFNAEARGVAQVGGVFTPPAQRARGYARAAVAGSLRLARQRGATRSVLFTGQTNQPARRAYEALGFRVIGDFGLVLF